MSLQSLTCCTVWNYSFHWLSVSVLALHSLIWKQCRWNLTSNPPWILSPTRFIWLLIVRWNKSVPHKFSDHIDSASASKTRLTAHSGWSTSRTPLRWLTKPTDTEREYRRIWISLASQCRQSQKKPDQVAFATFSGLMPTSLRSRRKGCSTLSLLCLLLAFTLARTSLRARLWVLASPVEVYILPWISSSSESLFVNALSNLSVWIYHIWGTYRNKIKLGWKSEIAAITGYRLTWER